MKNASVTLADAIDKYLETAVREVGRTKFQVLTALKTFPIANLPCNEIVSPDITELATELGQSRGPSTVQNYLSHLSAIFSIARPAWGYELDERAIRDAMKVTKRIGITGPSNKRDRRPSLDELDGIMDYLTETYNRNKHSYPRRVPMHKIVAFALFSTRRQEEITRLLWADLDDCSRSMR